MDGKGVGHSDGLALQVPWGEGAKRREGRRGGYIPKTWLRSEGQGSVTKKADEVTGHRKQLQDGELGFYMGCM